MQLLAAALLALVAAFSPTAARTTPAAVTPATTPAHPCAAAPTARITHVVWVWMENEDLPRIVGNPQAPYQTALARSCGLATRYRALTHPSLPNYLGAVAGSTLGVTDDAEPAAHPLKAPSLFSQLTAKGLPWRGYAESMPANCGQVTTSLYAARHNPAVFFTGVRAACRAFDVPMGGTTGTFARALAAGRLPSFAFVTPNICDDAHSCPIRTGDRWLASWLPRLFASPAYRDGSTVVMLTYDEGIGAAQTIPLIVANAAISPHTTVTTAANHYALLRTTEDLLGLPALGAARTAPDLRRALGLT